MKQIRHSDYSYIEDISQWEKKHKNRILKWNGDWYVTKKGQVVKEIQ